MHFGGGQIDVGRHNVEILEIGVVNHAVHVHARIEQRRVHGILHRVGVDAETHRGGALPAVLAERAADIDGTGGLADATLLVAHGDDPCRTVRLQRLRCGKRLIITSKQIRRHTVYLTNILVSKIPLFPC